MLEFFMRRREFVTLSAEEARTVIGALAMIAGDSSLHDTTRERYLRLSRAISNRLPRE